MWIDAGSNTFPNRKCIQLHQGSRSIVEELISQGFPLTKWRVTIAFDPYEVRSTPIDAGVIL